jgi:Rho-type GTPase-activating protein 1/2
MDGLSVAHSEYDRELKARRESEAEVTRLRVLLSGQAARLSALTGDSRKTEIRQQKTKELHDNLSGLERDLSNLKVQRDMAIAEVEELSAQKRYLFLLRVKHTDDAHCYAFYTVRWMKLPSSQPQN